jgi:hypothetical protein
MFAPDVAAGFQPVDVTIRELEAGGHSGHAQKTACQNE